MSKPYVYITRNVPAESLEPLRDVAEVEMWPHKETPVPREVLLEKAKTSDALFTMLSDKIDAEVLDSAENLKVVANLAVGFDNIDVPHATEKKIAVCNTPEVLTDTTADLTFALLMATARRLPEAVDYVKNGEWQNWAPLLMAGHDVHHKTIGIVGMGRIGQTVAKRATGFDMNILYHNRSRKTEAENELGASYVSFDELIETSDFVVCMAPATNDTEDLFTYEVFEKMKSSAIFINASRGSVVVENDLEKALANKEIAAAGLDVFRHEPIGADHPLLKHSNVVALPHIGSASVETRKEMTALVSRNIRNVLEGNSPEAIVNEEVL
ncbi:2-hydroxyacid dehydrogenase [Salisediminibacterium halotolerans]|uniref:Glyoxylate reductase n=1 Tax=Salisediminibacterium halotolerans TaxID=517425 RepID=A0A1H9VN37_9BACI|nr:MULTISPECIES: D-glycerate dehydrogenase [Salisediminibacterium]RLJ75390.1 glyoxylate reductase [Actinophytocola xinjiangensis]RPE89244.1 glyoxylate reductase [Salisediminibacterium halotolerans]TWG36003.1 glyoxylate reductase [Salisediminibacterium halotolerans]SES22613.1 glyoxylate reductase [Salisediminibacterium haloalkalitolerans]GEL07796.1 D-glycerate dehydrogenase [Salisediminibacterium halotolerans]